MTVAFWYCPDALCPRFNALIMASDDEAADIGCPACNGDLHRFQGRITVEAVPSKVVE